MSEYKLSAISSIVKEHILPISSLGKQKFEKNREFGAGSSTAEKQHQDFKHCTSLQKNIQYLDIRK